MNRVRNNTARVVPSEMFPVVEKQGSISKPGVDTTIPAGQEVVRLSRNLRRMKRRLLLSVAKEQELKSGRGSSQDLSAQTSFDDKSSRDLSVQGSYEE